MSTIILSNEKKLPERAVADIVKEMSANDTSLSEILKIVRISQETHEETSKSFENKHRRVISSRDFFDELNIVRYGG